VYDPTPQRLTRNTASPISSFTIFKEVGCLEKLSEQDWPNSKALGIFHDSADSFHFTAAAEFTVCHVEGEYAGEQLGLRDAFLFEPAIFILNFEGFLFATFFLNFFFQDLWDHNFL